MPYFCDKSRWNSAFNVFKHLKPQTKREWDVSFCIMKFENGDINGVVVKVKILMMFLMMMMIMMMDDDDDDNDDG